MKIAIVNLTGGGLSHGYLKYLMEMLPRMSEDSRLSRLEVFVPPGFSTRFTEIMPEKSLRHCDNSFRGRRELRREIARISPDVVFFPGNRWLEVGFPSVSMVQSMLPMVMPFSGNGFWDAAKNLERIYATKTACRRATRLIAVSRYVQEFLVDTWHLAPSRVGMVYHGVSPPPAVENSRIPGSVPRDWSGRFLFTAGSMHPYRGLDDVLQATAILASQGVRLPLVVAGGTDGTSRSYLKKMQNLAARLGVYSQIAWTGHLETAEMSWCYLHCRLFLMTSRVEACPNIALEAMSHGAVCLAADNPPLPEIFQKAALYYFPKSGQALAQAISAALNSPELAEEMRTQAGRRAADFTWEKTVELTIRELELAANMVYS